MYRYIPVHTTVKFSYCLIPCCTGTYWYVPVCTILPYPVQVGSRIPDVDSFWMSQETTCLLECTHWYVPVHTSTYDREILVLPCTVFYQYVLVRTSMYRFVQSCPGVQDSRCSAKRNLNFLASGNDSTSSGIVTGRMYSLAGPGSLARSSQCIP